MGCVALTLCSAQRVRRLMSTPITLKPSYSLLAFIGVIVSPGIIFFVLTCLYDEALPYGIVGALGSVAIWFSVASIRVSFDGSVISRRVFWRVSWKAEIGDVVLKRGLGGDVRFIPAILVQDRKSEREIGQILTVQFDAEDLRKFEQVLAARGMTISPAA